MVQSYMQKKKVQYYSTPTVYSNNTFVERYNPK